VFAGDTLRVVAEVLELRPSNSRPSGVARFKLTTLNQDGNEVLTQVAIVMIPCRPPASAA
jgi:acyl dehydratase